RFSRDWSSDVCSSDLPSLGYGHRPIEHVEVSSSEYFLFFRWSLNQIRFPCHGQGYTLHSVLDGFLATVCFAVNKGYLFVFQQLEYRHPKSYHPLVLQNYTNPQYFFLALLYSNRKINLQFLWLRFGGCSKSIDHIWF